jgi:hypothetical protein
MRLGGMKTKFKLERELCKLWGDKKRHVLEGHACDFVEI